MRSIIRNAIVSFISIVLLGGIFAASHWELKSQKNQAQAAGCFASVAWNTSSIKKGGSATEAWAITGADRASGVCTDGANINSSVANLSLGPQSYTFNNIQKSITCSVTGYINNVASCNASAKIAVEEVTSPIDPLPTVTLTVNPTSIDISKISSAGPSATLSWSSTNAVSCTASEGQSPLQWSGSKPTSGSQSTGNLDFQSTTFVLTCSNASGQQTSAQATVELTNSESLLCLFPNATNYRQNLPCVFPDLQPSFSSNGNIQFIKRVLNIPTLYNDGAQHITEAIALNNKFVFAGDCGVDMSGKKAGGGLWIVSEDGSSVTERQMCLDAGSGTNVIYQHGQVTGGLHVNWSGNGFVKENISLASCLKPGSNQSCLELGSGANKAVYYSASGAPISTSPKSQYNHSLIVLKNRILARIQGVGYKILGLPDWNLTGAASFNGGVAFGDFVFNNGALYSVSSGGDVQEIKKLASGKTVQNGTNYYYSYDNSVSPAKLAILEVNTKPGNIIDMESRKIYVYKLLSGGVSLDKTINLPANFPNISGYGNFGVWGNYIVTRNNNPAEIELWNGSQKIDTIKLPGASGVYPTGINISKNGYVSALAYSNDEGKTAAYIFKIKGTSGTSPSNPLPEGGGTGVGVSGTCYQKYSGNIQLRLLCEQIEALKAQACKLNPNLSFCAN